MAKKKLYKADGVTEDFDAEALEPDETSTDAGSVADMLKTDDASKDAPKDDAAKSDDVAKAGDSTASSSSAPAIDVPEASADKPVGTDTSVAGGDSPKVAGGMLPLGAGEEEAKADPYAQKQDSGSLAVAPSTEEAATQATDSAKPDAVAATPTASSASTTDGATSTEPVASTDASADAAPEQEDLGEAHDEAKPAVDIAPDVMDELKKAGNMLAPALKKLGNFEEKFAELENEAKARFDHMRQKATEAVAALEAIFKRG